MVALPIQSGVKVVKGSLVTSHPVNLRQKTVESGISRGQLVTLPGVRTLSTGPGRDRGGIVWNGVQYRVMGGSFVSVSGSGAISVIGSVADDGRPCGFIYGYDRLAVRAAEKLYYYDSAALEEVTDPDLGRVVDLTWLGGYFITTDGRFIVVSELNNATAIDPLKYGEPESDPDPTTGVLALNEELLAFGRHSIQVFRNVGGIG